MPLNKPVKSAMSPGQLRACGKSSRNILAAGKDGKTEEATFRTASVFYI
jgi:hypothetical protein